MENSHALIGRSLACRKSMCRRLGTKKHETLAKHRFNERHHLVTGRQVKFFENHKEEWPVESRQPAHSVKPTALSSYNTLPTRYRLPADFKTLKKIQYSARFLYFWAL